MGLQSKNPVAGEDGLLASDNAASNLLSLAAQIALEVKGTECSSVNQSQNLCSTLEKNLFGLVNIVTFPNLMILL